ncbi:hypothetical protein PQX77_008093 [Marasmius sp. AFHP31]|nr:hypothetical protein PQX77_008093 [Marasmius sp. AFHP31]
MQLRRPLVFLLHFLLKNSASFDIEGLPTQVKPNDGATASWNRQIADPTNFALAAVTTPFDSGGFIYIGSTNVQELQLKGAMKFKFYNDKVKTLTVAAYNIQGIPLSDLGKMAIGQLSLPTPFYVHSPPVTIGDTADSNSPTGAPPARTSVTPTSAISGSPTTSKTQTLSQSAPRSSSAPASASSATSTQSASGTIKDFGDNTMNGAGSITDSGSQSGQRDLESGSPNFTATSQQETSTATTGPGNAHPSGSNLGNILGGVFGALALVLLTMLAIFCYRRRNKDRQVQSRKLAGTPITFFKDKMVHRLDDQSQEGEKSLPGHWDSDQEWLPPSAFVAHSTNWKDPDGTSLTDSLTTDLPLSTAYAYTITEDESDITSTITGGLSEIPNNAKGGLHGAGARTDRQMEIEGKIFELQRDIIRMRATGGDAVDVAQLRDRIERLRQLQGGKWARELSNEVPSEMVLKTAGTTSNKNPSASTSKTPNPKSEAPPKKRIAKTKGMGDDDNDDDGDDEEPKSKKSWKKPAKGKGKAQDNVERADEAKPLAKKKKVDTAVKQSGTKRKRDETPDDV